MDRNEKHWLAKEDLENGTFGRRLDEAVVEIKNLLSLLELAFSWPELMAAAVRPRSQPIRSARHDHRPLRARLNSPAKVPRDTKYL